MAGHSKWANIKHRKDRQDKKRGAQWSKCSKAIMAAARIGGGDPVTNLALRYAIDEAKYANMPKDTIKRAIDKGAGAATGENFEAITYEGYGPNGVAILIEALTDNRNRTVTDVRTVFKKLGGSMGSAGSVAFMFKNCGHILVEASKASEDTLMDQAIEAGAVDVEMPEADDGFFTITTDPTEFLAVKDALEAAGVEVAQAMLTKVADNTVELRGDDAEKLLRMVEAFEDAEDVQKVYTNADILDEEIEALG